MGRNMKLLTNQQAADMLGVKSNTLEIWRLHGKGPRFRKLGAGKQAPVRYVEDDVLAWLDEQSFASTSAYSPAATTHRKSHSYPPRPASA